MVKWGKVNYIEYILIFGGDKLHRYMKITPKESLNCLIQCFQCQNKVGKHVSVSNLNHDKSR